MTLASSLRAVLIGAALLGLGACAHIMPSTSQRPATPQSMGTASAAAVAPTVPAATASVPAIVDPDDAPKNELSSHAPTIQSLPERPSLAAPQPLLSQAPILLAKGAATTPAPKSAPLTRVIAANRAARAEPDADAFADAVQVYAYRPGALYQVYTSPGFITQISLAPGETLVGPGPVAAGDTLRWIIGDTVSGSGNTKRVQILVKPTRVNLKTNLIINTDKRTYYIELKSEPATYMAAIAWHYPEDEMAALTRATAAEEPKPGPAGPNITALNFGYVLKGDHVRWRPHSVFDDGRQVFIAFGPEVDQGELPPLFVIGPEGLPELASYRVQGGTLIVDRLFDEAELRLGSKRVRIVRPKGRSS